MSTISGKVITGQVYVGPGKDKYVYASPLTITSTGTLVAQSVFAAEAIYATASTPWSVVNYGLVSGWTTNAAIRGRGAAGVVVNQGTMMDGNAVIELYNGGNVINTGEIIQGGVGIYIGGGSGTVTNSATVTGVGLGIYIIDGGDVTNTGLITAGGSGIDFFPDGAGTVSNSGTIVGQGTAGAIFQKIAGVELKAGGSVTNSNPGMIKGNIGVYVKGAGMVTNSGTIIGAASYGVSLETGGTIVDSGKISGAGGTAVSFGGTGGNRLVLDPGYHFGGKAVGSTSAGATNTLELGSAASIGTVSGLGARFVNFGTVTVDAGARWVLGGGSTIGNGGTLSNAGTVSGGLIVESGGSEFVLSGGAASGTVLRGGSEIVSAGGAASATIVDSGGTELLHGRASGGTVSSGGHQYVSAGGVAGGVTVRHGGNQTVFLGGITRGTVLSGGSEVVSAGGKASGTIIDSGGNETVRGTTSADTVNSGGRQTISAGGVASGVTVKGGGIETVLSGGTTRATVLSGGSEVVSSGGTASGTIVASGGAETVRGRASGGTIKGGLIEVASGGTASGTITFVNGGTLQLDASTGFTGAIKGFAVPDRIDLRGLAFGSSTTRSFTEAASKTSGTLTVTSGTHTVHLTLLGTYTTSNFKLATDGHGGTLVTDPPVAGGGTRTTFADIAPAQPLAGAANSVNQPNYLPGAAGTNEQAYTGQTLLTTGAPGTPSGGNNHTLLPTSR